MNPGLNVLLPAFILCRHRDQIPLGAGDDVRGRMLPLSSILLLKPWAELGK